ncbi:MAG: phytoene desaturase [Acidobacteria bacterium]|nr:MAG: phytoene desaturase [Acidobacteriota bacterium]
MSQQSDRIGVVGSGLGGLAAACTLAARGHSVVLFEKNPWLGGKAAQLESDGFRFDMGPTILTVPRVLRRVFEEAGRRLEDELDLVRLDPQWRCFYEDGSVLDLVEDTDEMAASLRQYSSAEVADGYRDFIALSQRLHDISERFFFWKSVQGIGDTLDLRGSFSLSTLRDVLALRMGSTVAGAIRRRVSDERVAQMLDHFTQYVGSSPYGSPAVLCSIAHMQTEGGVWYPRGGTRAVPEALARLAGELGVEVRTNVSVDRLRIEDGQVVGVDCTQGGARSRHEFVPLAAVVSNMDAVRTYRELAGAPSRSDATVGREPACSGVVLYLGLDRRYDHLLHHNFVFSRSPEREFEQIYELGQPADDPTCYVAAPSCSEPEVAPAGGEALYVLVHTPYLRPGHDWNVMLPAYRRTILDKLARVGGMPDLEERIVFEQALTPEDIHRRYRVLDGAIYGLASHGRFRGAFKPGNRSRSLRGLYLAGGAAHPGPGMPMVMMSGWIAADSLDQDLSGALGRDRSPLAAASSAALVG